MMSHLYDQLQEFASLLLHPDFKRPDHIETEYGVHGVKYDYDEDGDSYAEVGFVLPKRCFAVIEDGTYGSLNAIRIYTGDKEAS
jgi:hypothetical protein